MLAEQKLAALIRKLERQAVGILPPDTVMDAVGRPIADHLVAFLGDLEARGRFLVIPVALIAIASGSSRMRSKRDLGFRGRRY